MSFKEKQNTFQKSLKPPKEEDEVDWNLEERIKKATPRELQEFVDKTINNYISEFSPHTTQKMQNLSDIFGLNLTYFRHTCIRKQTSQNFFSVGALSGAYQSVYRIINKKDITERFEDKFQKSNIDLTDSNSDEKKEDWNLINRVKESNPEEMQDFVESIIHNYISAFLSNDTKSMHQLLDNSEYNLNYFKDGGIKTTLNQKYYTVGKLYGAFRLVGAIIDHNNNRENSLYSFQKGILDDFPWATEILLYIGNSNLSSIEEKDVYEHFKDSKDMDEIKAALNKMKAYSFIYYHTYGNDCTLYLSDPGRLVFGHYNKQPEEEVYYSH